MSDNGKLEFKLKLDEEKSKELKRGKQMFKDDEGHRWYFTKDEVEQLTSPKEVVLEVRPA